jgi:CspA family cold shock protein
MLLGTVKSFNYDRGWGFIRPDDGGRDVFVHVRSLGKIELRAGQRVGYNFKMMPKGPKALNVIILLSGDEASRVA